AAHLALAGASAAGFLAGAADPVAGHAFGEALELDFLGDAGGDLGERERELDLEVGAARRAAAAASASSTPAPERSVAAEDVSELGEDVLEVAEPLAAAEATAARTVHPGMAEAVVLGLLGFVGK